MSYYTFASSEYDLPHPTLSRHQPRFYIPDRSTYSPGPSSAGLVGETLSMHSRHPSVLDTGYSGHSTPFNRAGSFYGSASRTSLAQLRHVLHSYHAHASASGTGAGDVDPLTPPRQMSRAHRAPFPVPPEGEGEHVHVHGRECDASSGDLMGHEWDPDMWSRVAGDPMEALIDIHRVLYRGSEDLSSDNPLWSEQGQEVKRVVEQWFEGDCVYDHPLIRLSSRQSVLTHFALLQLFSTAYVPSFTPSSMLLHARNLTSRIRGVFLSSDEIPAVEARARDAKGKRVVDPVDEWLETSGNRQPVVHRDHKNDGWWKLWDVSAECRDIGCMECYEGYHIALIDHVISLSLFPSIIKRPSPRGLVTPTDSTDSLATLDLPQRSFVYSLAASLLSEFDFLLRWNLPVSTIVEFNEVGKATHVRDVVDVQDVIDTFVPFAKRFSWLSRRMAGLVTSTVGSIALSLIPGHTVLVGDPIKIMSDEQQQDKDKIKELAAKPGLGSPIGLLPDPSAVAIKSVTASPFGDASNLLGLEGVSSMAPDVDVEGQDV